MPPPEPHLDPTAFDFERPVADRSRIREILPHRGAMELLTAVVHCDFERHLVAGYTDVGADDFWAAGHFPGNPLMPGVLMVEAAAQLTCYYSLVMHLPRKALLGLGGVENTRFRRAVVPGERLVMVGKGLRVRPRLTLFNVQGYVGSELAFHTDVLGVMLGKVEE